MLLVVFATAVVIPVRFMAAAIIAVHMLIVHGFNRELILQVKGGKDNIVLGIYPAEAKNHPK